MNRVHTVGVGKAQYGSDKMELEKKSEKQKATGSLRLFVYGK